MEGEYHSQTRLQVNPESLTEITHKKPEKDYYQIVVRHVSKVSPVWKILHILIFSAIAVGGLVATVLFGKILAGYNFNCILYADVEFKNISSDTQDANSLDSLVIHNLPMIDYTTTTWSSSYYCSFCQFMPLVSTFCAVIWAIFFLMLSRGGSGHPADLFDQPWKIVTPALIFCILMMIPVGISYSMSVNGYEKFCDNFKKIGRSCKVIDLYPVQFVGETKHIDAQYVIVGDCIRSVFYMWLLQVVILILRMFYIVDFQFVKITAFKDQQKTERLSITGELHFLVPQSV